MFKGGAIYFLGIILLFGMLSCEQKPNYNKIYNSLPEDQAVELDTSLIFAGFGISIKDIESKINSELGANLYSDKDYVTRNGIRMKIDVDRTGEIELNGTGNRLLYKIPIKVKGQILIKETILGVKIRAEPRFELNLTLSLSSRFKFYNNFKYGISTKITKIEWPRKPIIQAGPIKIDLSEAIESVLLANEENLSMVINQTAESQIKLKELVLNSIKSIPKYNYIKTKDIDLWMELSPLNFIIESTPKIENDTIKVKSGLITFLNLISYNGDSSNIDIDELSLIAIEDFPDKFNLELKVNIAYLDLDTLLQKQIKKKGILSSLPEGISIANLKTGKLKRDKVYLSADVGGKLKGSILNSGVLQFDSITNSIYLDQMESQFYSDNWIWSVLYKLFFPGLKSQIQDKISWPLDPLFIKVQHSVKKLISRISAGEMLELELRDLEFEIRKFNLKRDEIEILIKVEGQSKLNVQV